MFLKNHRYIFLSNKLNDVELRYVMAHELGHAIMDRKENCYFIRNKTLLSVSKFERRANLFAAYLLISDELLAEYSGCTLDQFCRATGYPMELAELRVGVGKLWE
jgi:Zn-dependent peptidase ImmA (M78 family)